MKSVSFSRIQNESHRAEVFVEPCLAGVANVKKMITNSGKSGEIYTKLQVTRE
jgi:hypothetical protein